MINRQSAKFLFSGLIVALASAVQAQTPAVEKFTPLPEATSSFGAVVSDGYLYVYGGHITKNHLYNTDAQSGKFHRLSLKDPQAKWEELSSGPTLQGMNLAAYDGKIYRLGGMQSRNKPGDKTENFSVTDSARYDPATGKWQEITALPVSRSSHDLAVISGKLYVVGGWSMNGKAGDTWLSEIHVMNLADANASWSTIKAPFERRALIVSVHNDKLYVLGGFTQDDEPSLKVDIFDPASGKWSSGPDLPGKEINGFAPAACSIGGDLYVSVGDGTLARLDEQNNKWETVAKTTPRIVHRLAPDGSRILIVGGAARGDNLNLIESVNVGKSQTADAR